MTSTMPEAIAKLGEALELLAHAARDDRETIGELAAASTRNDTEHAELRDSIVELSSRVTSLQRTLDSRTEQAA